MKTDLASAPTSGRAATQSPTAPAPALVLRTILVPTDFSLPATEALRRAEHFARHAGARLVLLHAFDNTEFTDAAAADLGSIGPLAQYRAQARLAAAKELEAVAQASRDRGLEVETRFCVGHPARLITATAAEVGADLIVLSTHGRTGWKRLVLGSVAESVVRFAPCPVYSLHAHPDSSAEVSAIPTAAPVDTLAGAPLRLRRILVPTDFSPAAACALPWAEKLARESDAIVTLLHVFSPSKLAPAHVGSTGFGLATPLVEIYVRQVREDIERQLHALCDSLRARGLTVETLQLDGEPAERVCGAAQSMHSDLVVLATKGVSGWDRPLVGSTAERIVRYANSPVLVVRSAPAGS